MIAMKYTEIFVPGGFPRHTYNPRLSLELEQRVNQVRENLCKLVTVTGHTKSGKTVLVRKVLPPEECVWVDGGTVGEEEDFWQTCANQLNLFQTVASQTTNEETRELALRGTAEAGIIVAKGKAEIGGTVGSSAGSSSSQSRTVRSRVIALSELRAGRQPLVIDDFHYLPRHVQGSLIRALKPLIFDGLPVVIIAIPHRRYDSIRVEKEMTGRILPVDIPSWSVDELEYIPRQGYRLLGTSLSPSTTSRLVDQAIGSPHLMQEFCRGLCRQKRLEENAADDPLPVSDADTSRVFTEIAQSIGRPIFEKLARGPRQRTDRIPRRLKSGKSVDIYGLVLHALAQLQPGLVTLEYEGIRSAIRDVSADQVPQLQEVARVLKHMSEIAATDQSSIPVIDFEEREKRLHVTDPFFAFYLRWGEIDI
jgi:hypothetical protein